MSNRHSVVKEIQELVLHTRQFCQPPTLERGMYCRCAVEDSMSGPPHVFVELALRSTPVLCCVDAH